MPAGPDFSRAALRWAGTTEPVVGDVEIHLRADDWHLHGHHGGPGVRPRHPARGVGGEKGRGVLSGKPQPFRRVPQVVLSTQLIAPWEELRAALR